MNNLSPYGGSKNAPWSRAATPANSLVGATSNTLQHQIMSQQQTPQNSSVASLNTNMISFPQQQVFQSLGMQQQNLGLTLPQMAANAPVNVAGSQQISANQLFQQFGNITYPTSRPLNSAAFQQCQQPQQQQPRAQGPPATTNAVNAAQRVFTGTVTAVHDNFGFVDEDVFFQMSACVNSSSPVVGDRVLVEAVYNSRMPFKWNATRIQVLTLGSSTVARSKKNYSSVPPPTDTEGSYSKSAKSFGNRRSDRTRSRDRDVEDGEVERKRRREERLRDREKEEKKSPVRNRRSRSPNKNRRRARIVPRYMIQIPKVSLDLKSADVLELRRRYNNLYVPSDFFVGNFRWIDAFPADKPFALNKPCSFYVLPKEAAIPDEKKSVFSEPEDADYSFSAKVMLMSIQGVEQMYHKCCALAEEANRRDGDEQEFVHPTRLISFLVGTRGKNETMAIGGPWSPSLDGERPDKEPAVLIRTAIRTCKALTGIDLSGCTKWYRFVELYYRRTDAKGKVPLAAAAAAAGGGRVETVVVFLPDVWSCVPTRLEWDSLQAAYQRAADQKPRSDEDASSEQQVQDGDEKDEEVAGECKPEPTHYLLLDPKAMSLVELRKELKARSMSASGLKSQLVARLAKALKSEGAKNSDDVSVKVKEDSVANDEEKKERTPKKQLQLPDSPSIIVHPSRTAKSGKFDCTVMTLSLLLDYRPEDTKEHSFEVSLFAELFNEMLMRDFGFNIYKALHDLPDKPKEKDEKKNKEKGKNEGKSDNSKEKKEKRESKSDGGETDNDDLDNDDKSNGLKDGSSKKKRERPKMFTKDRLLLLSFIYFDQTHCGYIFEKDLEELLYILGLNLSRAQVRKLLGKVITRDSLHYRKLTDKPSIKDDFIIIDDSEAAASDAVCQDLAVGNKKFLPIFVDSTSNLVQNESKASGAGCEESLVMFKGALIDIEKLLAQLDRSDKARLDSDERIVELKTENRKLQEKNTKISSNIKSLTNDFNEIKSKLKGSEDTLSKVYATQKLYEVTLTEIKEKIDPIITNKIKKDEKWVESKTRWEREVYGSPESVSVKEEKVTEN